MGGNLFTVLLATIRSRFAAITSRLRMWTSWSFIRSRVITKIRSFFTRLFDIKPKNERDYFSIFGWMVSKRLAYLVVILIGVVSLWYITIVRGVFNSVANGTRTYKYSSVSLRFAKNTVRITGKSGYLAYEGQVSGGYANGDGTLYNPQGAVVYRGHFEKSNYEQTGTTYYPNGGMWYAGTFHENLYDGTGKLYREDGSLIYDGEFSRGLKNGQGRLCDAAGNEVYTGQFAADEIVFAAFLGKTTQEAGQAYSGRREVWQGLDDFCVRMTDIGAIYAGRRDPDTLDESIVIEDVYVLSDTFPLGEKRVDKLSDIQAAWGDPLYEGNSAVELPEAVSINILNQTGQALSGKVDMDTESLFTDVTQINGFDKTYPVYLTTWENGGLLYSFISGSRNGQFSFYRITQTEGAPS